jgi:general stress protein YciG
MADNTNRDRGNQQSQDRDGGRMSGATNQRDMNQGSGQRSGGNFANDRERAREAGRKGGSR